MITDRLTHSPAVTAIVRRNYLTLYNVNRLAVYLLVTIPFSSGRGKCILPKVDPTTVMPSDGTLVNPSPSIPAFHVSLNHDQIPLYAADGISLGFRSVEAARRLIAGGYAKPSYGLAEPSPPKPGLGYVPMPGG